MRLIELHAEATEAAIWGITERCKRCTIGRFARLQPSSPVWTPLLPAETANLDRICAFHVRYFPENHNYVRKRTKTPKICISRLILVRNQEKRLTTHLLGASRPDLCQKIAIRGKNHY
ncbi:MAG: hypothetical protein ACRYHA_27470 [Janthinobacterium lividum]